MNYSISDRLREVERRTNRIGSDIAHLKSPEAAIAFPGYGTGNTAALIDANGQGELTVNNFPLTNGLSIPLWVNSPVLFWDNPTNPIIIDSNAATLLQAAWDGVGDNLLIASYTAWKAAAGGFFPTGPLDPDFDDTRFEIVDPNNLLTNIVADDVVLFETGPATANKPNSLTVIELAAGGGGTTPPPSAVAGQGLAPDPASGPNAVGIDPGTGIKIGADGSTEVDQDALSFSTVNVISADVNDPANVTAGGAIVFDNAVDLLGAAGTPTGSANNPINVPAVDNQKFVAMQDKGGTWETIFAAQNIIRSTVNKSGGVVPTDATFPFIGGVVLRGKEVTSGTAANVPGSYYHNAEEIILFQRDDGVWQPIFGSNQGVLVVRGTTPVVDGSSTPTFILSSLVAVRGRLPRSAAGAVLTAVTVTNNPACLFASGDTGYAVFDLTASVSESSQWTTGYAGNMDAILRGYVDYDDTKKQSLTQDNGTLKWAAATIRIVHGNATAAVAGGAFTIDSLVLKVGDTLPGSPLSVSNPFAFDIDSGGLAQAIEASDGTWWADQAACPA